MLRVHYNPFEKTELEKELWLNIKEHTKKYIQKNAKNTSKTIKQKKGIMDYKFYIGTNKQE